MRELFDAIYLTGCWYEHLDPFWACSPEHFPIGPLTTWMKLMMEWKRHNHPVCLGNPFTGAVLFWEGESVIENPTGRIF